MSVITGVLIAVLFLWITARTIGYAIWNWKNKNKTGAVMILLVNAISVTLPVYIVFYKS